MMCRPFWKWIAALGMISLPGRLMQATKIPSSGDLCQGLPRWQGASGDKELQCLYLVIGDAVQGEGRKNQWVFSMARTYRTISLAVGDLGLMTLSIPMSLKTPHTLTG